MSEGGDCFPAAATLAKWLDLAGVPDVHLCHGFVDGQGPVAGQRFAHAWVESEGQFVNGERSETVVLDFSNGNQATMRRERYYAIGSIDEVVRYTADEATVLCLDSGHWGPWIETNEEGTAWASQATPTPSS